MSELLNRRAILARAAAATVPVAALLAATIPAIAAPAAPPTPPTPEPDPIFALIKAHRKAWRALERATSAEDRLRLSLPEEIKREPRCVVGEERVAYVREKVEEWRSRIPVTAGEEDWQSLLRQQS